MSTFERGMQSLAEQLDGHMEGRREYQLLEQVEAEGREAEREACKRDVCTYCGGRGPTHERGVVGPNDAGNYVHQPTASYASSGGGSRLCAATTIFTRERYEATKKAQRTSAAGGEHGRT